MLGLLIVTVIALTIIAGLLVRLASAHFQYKLGEQPGSDRANADGAASAGNLKVHEGVNTP